MFRHLLPTHRETRYAFDPAAFLAGLPGAHYEWPDLRRLIRRGAAVSPAEIICGDQQCYAFLGQLTGEEGPWVSDPGGRQAQAYAFRADDLSRLRNQTDRTPLHTSGWRCTDCGRARCRVQPCR